jgi:hypothetical protein
MDSMSSANQLLANKVHVKRLETPTKHCDRIKSGMVTVGMKSMLKTEFHTHLPVSDNDPKYLVHRIDKRSR